MFSKGKNANLGCSIICRQLEDNISSTVCKFDDNVDILAVSLLISNYTFSSQILSSIAIISFYILYKIFVLKHKQLFDARLV